MLKKNSTAMWQHNDYISFNGLLFMLKTAKKLQMAAISALDMNLICDWLYHTLFRKGTDRIQELHNNLC